MNPIEVIFGAIERGLGAILAGIYSVIPSYGLAIIVLTILIRLALYPITARSTKSMRKMSLLQPHMKKLQEKYKDDRQRLSEEQMKLFKANKVSPVSGCLPLLIQMPFLLAMFRVIVGQRGLPVGEVSTAFLPAGSRLAEDLVHATLQNPGPANFLGLNLAISPQQAFQNSDAVGVWGLALQVLVIAVIVATGVYQQRQMQAQRSVSQAEGPAQAMQNVGKVMPIVFGVISIFWPAGLNVYWLTSNAFQIGQQALILRGDEGWEPVIPKEEKRGKGPGGQRGSGTKGAQSAKRAKGPVPNGKGSRGGEKGAGSEKGGGARERPRKRVPRRVAPKSKASDGGKRDSTPGSKREGSGSDKKD